MIYEPYLDIRDVSNRRATTEQRCGTSRLRIETSRWERLAITPRQSNNYKTSRKLKRHERTCKLCFGEVESEMHFLLDCPRYDTLRIDWLRRVRMKEPWVAKLLPRTLGDR